MLPSWDGKFVVLGFSAGGAEYSELRVLDVERRALLPETIYPSYGPSAWTKDSKSFLYDAGKVTDIKSPEIELNRKTRLHKLGLEVASDRDFFSNESNPELGITPKEFPSANIDESYPDYIMGFVGTVQAELRIFYAPTAAMNRGKIRWEVLCKTSDKLVRGIAAHGDHVYAVTHSGAPKYKLVRTSVKHPDWEHAETVIPEAADSIQSIAKSRHYLFVVYSNGVIGRIVKYDLATGQSTEVKLPASGTVDISCPDWRTDRCLVYITSWTFPLTIYDFEARKDTFVKSIFNTDAVYPGFENLVSEEVEVPGQTASVLKMLFTNVSFRASKS